MTKPKKQKASPPLVAFEGFARGEGAAVSIGEVERQLVRSAARMAQADDAELRVLGQMRLDSIAQLATKSRVQPLQASVAARMKRPGRIDPMREHLLALMRQAKRAGTEFKVALANLEREAVDGLRIEYDRETQKYAITDGNADSDLVLEYTLGTLEKLYSKA